MPSSESDRSEHEQEHDEGHGPEPQTRADWRNRPRKEPKKRDTHFICLPLVTTDSLPTLAKSLQYFRRATTASARKPPIAPHQRRTADTDDDLSQPKKDNLKADAGASPQEDTPETPPISNHPTQANSHHETSEKLRVVPAGAHRPPGTFHLTLGTMDLSSPSEMTRALSLLESLDLQDLLLEASSTSRTSIPTRPQQDSPVSIDPQGHNIPSLTRPISPPPNLNHKTRPTSPSDRSAHPSPPPPLNIALTGLGAFSSPTKARVLFAHPHDTTQRLFPFAQAIREVFREAGFITEKRELTLHATMANMRYANRDSNGRGKGRKPGPNWGNVNGRALVEFFEGKTEMDGGGLGETEADVEGNEEENGNRDDQGKYIWADGIVVDRVRICKMGAVKSDDEMLGMVYPPIGEKLIFGKELVKVF